MGPKPVSVSRGAFRFCRYSMALLMTWAVLGRRPELALASAALMAASALLSVRRAPLIALYTATVERLAPSVPEVLDENAMRLAHSLATVAIGVPLLGVYFGGAWGAHLGWRVLALVAGLKAVAAVTGCPVARMFTCALQGGTCCGFARRSELAGLPAAGVSAQAANPEEGSGGVDGAESSS